MNPIKISIITVNLNNNIGLMRTLNSVAKQSYDNYEHIIIDGDSQDASSHTIAQYAASNKHVSYWISEKDNGIYNAMNKGITKAKGEYLLFLNSGDSLEDEALNKSCIFLTEKELIYGNLFFTSPTGERHLQIFPDPPFDITTLILQGFYLPHPATFIKCELIKKHLYSEQYKIISDWEFWLKAIIFENCSIKHININISNFCEGGISSNIADIQKERIHILTSLFPPLILNGLQELTHIKNSPFYESIKLIMKDEKSQVKMNKLICLYHKIHHLFFSNKK